MKKNFWFLIVSVIVLALIVSIPFFLNNDLENNFLTVYLVAKIIFGLLFIGSVIYCFAKQTSNGISYSLIVINIIVQFIPLILRGLFKLESHQIMWSIIVIGLSLIVYVSLFGAILTMNKKMLVRENKYQGHEIEVKEENDNGGK